MPEAQKLETILCKSCLYCLAAINIHLNASSAHEIKSFAKHEVDYKEIIDQIEKHHLLRRNWILFPIDKG
jgi:hypothetical protein